MFKSVFEKQEGPGHHQTNVKEYAFWMDMKLILLTVFSVGVLLPVEIDGSIAVVEVFCKDKNAYSQTYDGLNKRLVSVRTL